MTRPKHVRPRWRYLALGLRSWPDAAVDRRAVQEALWGATRDLWGDAGSAGIDPAVVEFQWEDGQGEAMLRVRRARVQEARAAVACLRAVDGEPIGTRVRGVSGTRRACAERHLGRKGEAEVTTTVAFDGAERSAVRRGAAVDVRIDGAFVGATECDTG